MMEPGRPGPGASPGLRSLTSFSLPEPCGECRVRKNVVFDGMLRCEPVIFLVCITYAAMNSLARDVVGRK